MTAWGQAGMLIYTQGWLRGRDLKSAANHKQLWDCRRFPLGMVLLHDSCLGGADDSLTAPPHAVSSRRGSSARCSLCSSRTTFRFRSWQCTYSKYTGGHQLPGSGGVQSFAGNVAVDSARCPCS